MPRSFNLTSRDCGSRIPASPRAPWWAGCFWANVAAALFAFQPLGRHGPKPPAASRNPCAGQLSARRPSSPAPARWSSKVQQARKEGDRFLSDYITDRRVTFATIAEELNASPKDAGIKQKEVSVVLEPVEGSDALSQMTISAGLRGDLRHLTKFVNLLDNRRAS